MALKKKIVFGLIIGVIALTILLGFIFFPKIQIENSLFEGETFISPILKYSGENEIVTYTPSTETHCIGNKCTKTLYSGTMFLNNGTEENPDYVPRSEFYRIHEGGFQDNTGLIYKLGTDEKYIDVYDMNNSYISSFGFGITGNVGGTDYTYTTLNFTWTWTSSFNETQATFYGDNNNDAFNWTQEFSFFPDKSMKIKNKLKNSLGQDITNTKFWYIQTINKNDSIIWNGETYNLNETINLEGEYDSLVPQIEFPDYYTFNYNDLIEHGFNITNIYVGDGDVIGTPGVWLLAIGVTANQGVFPNDVDVELDPTVQLQDADTENLDDTYIYSLSQAYNYGGATYLYLLSTGAYYQEIMLKFDLSSVAGIEIDNATLVLDAYLNGLDSAFEGYTGRAYLVEEDFGLPEFDLVPSGNEASHGVFLNDTHFLTTDSTDDEVYIYFINGTYTGNHWNTLGSIPKDNGNPGDIWCNDTRCFITDTLDDQVYIYDVDGTSLTRWAMNVSGGNGNGYGIFCNNTYCWTTEYTNQRVYKYFQNGTYIQLYEIGALSVNDNPIGIWGNGTAFFITDLTDDEVYIWDLDFSAIIDNWDTSTIGNGDGYGITGNESSLWMNDYTDDFVYEFYQNGTSSIRYNGWIEGTKTGSASTEQFAMIYLRRPSTDYYDVDLYDDVVINGDTIGKVNWNVTNLITEALANEYDETNIYISTSAMGVFGTPDTGDLIRFSSKEATTVGDRPLLNISYTIIADTTSPTWSNNQTNSTLAGTLVEHSVYLEDETALDYYIFSFANGTVTFVNDSPTDISGVTQWVNVTKRINTTIGSEIIWYVWVNDSTGNSNRTSNFSYLTKDVDSTSPNIRLMSPENATEYLDNLTKDFVCNVTDAESNIENVTLNIYLNDEPFYNITNSTEFSATSEIVVDFNDIELNLSNLRYKWNCEVYDTSNNYNQTDNWTFFDLNSTGETYVEMNLIPAELEYNQYPVYNVTNNTILDWKPYNITCTWKNPNGLRWLCQDDPDFGDYCQAGGLINTDWYINFTEEGYYPTEYTYTTEHPVETQAEEGDEWTRILYNITMACLGVTTGKEEFNYTDEEGVSEIFFGNDIDPQVRVVFVIDTETTNLADNLDEEYPDLITTNYDAGGITWNTFFNDIEGTENATFRQTETDELGGIPRLSWFDMTTRMYWENVNGLGKNPIYTLFANNDTYAEQISKYGDEVQFHFHNHQWYNYTEWVAGEGEPFNENASNWNQVMEFNNETLFGTNSTHNETSQGNMESVFSQRIIDEQQFTNVYRSGWLYYNTNLSNWLEGILKYDWGYNSNLGDNTDTTEPIENSYYWADNTNTYLQPYHPNETNYQLEGDMNRFVFPCVQGYETQEAIDNAFKEAYDRGKIIICMYKHNYGVDPDNIGTQIEGLHDKLVISEGDYSEVEWEWATTHEASKWYDRDNTSGILCEDDDVSPILTITQDEDYYYIESSEPLFADPYWAIKDTDGIYLKEEVIDNGVNNWKADKSLHSIDEFLFAGQDNCGNNFVQNQGIDAVILEYPASDNVADVDYPQEITVNFSVTDEGLYLDFGVTVINMTLTNSTGDYECSKEGEPSYFGDNIWQQDCSVPDGVGVYNFTIWANHSDAREVHDTEEDAVVYDTCTYSGSERWLIDCAENCQITTNTNLMNNSLYLYGSGIINLKANLYNLSYIIKDVQCSFIKEVQYNVFI